MKKYNVQNYVRYKKDLERCLKKIDLKNWSDCTRNELIINSSRVHSLQSLQSIFFKHSSKSFLYLT